MPRKFDEAYRGPPSWLDPKKELSLEESPNYPTRAAFVKVAMERLLAGGLLPAQAAGVVANAANESGWGKHCFWGNSGGWKITKAYADEYTRKHGEGPNWWKARGNVDSNDSPWCFYRAFGSLGEFLDEWVSHFVPKPEVAAPPYPGYKRCGQIFWNGGPWFPELILVGYKGGPSKLRMKAVRAVGMPDTSHPSVRDHQTMAKDCLEIYAQVKLGVDPDGAFGPKSVAALKAWQPLHGLRATGELDPPTLRVLFQP